MAGSGTPPPPGPPPTGTTSPFTSSRPLLKPGPPLGEGQTFSIVLVSIVSAALSAMALPFSIVALVTRVMLWSAIIFPSNAVLVPRVAELPTSQNTPTSEPLFVPKSVT